MSSLSEGGFCGDHSGHLRCIEGLKREHDKLEKNFQRCQECSGDWRNEFITTYQKKLDDKVPMKVFTWITGGLAVVGFSLFGVLLAQMDQIGALSDKVGVAISKQDIVKTEVYYLSEKIEKLDKRMEKNGR